LNLSKPVTLNSVLRLLSDYQNIPAPHHYCKSPLISRSSMLDFWGIGKWGAIIGEGDKFFAISPPRLDFVKRALCRQLPSSVYFEVQEIGVDIFFDIVNKNGAIYKTHSKIPIEEEEYKKRGIGTAFRYTRKGEGPWIGNSSEDPTMAFSNYKNGNLQLWHDNQWRKPVGLNKVSSGWSYFKQDAIRSMKDMIQNPGNYKYTFMVGDMSSLKKVQEELVVEFAVKEM